MCVILAQSKIRRLKQEQLISLSKQQTVILKRDKARIKVQRSLGHHKYQTESRLDLGSRLLGVSFYFVN